MHSSLLQHKHLGFYKAGNQVGPSNPQSSLNESSYAHSYHDKSSCGELMLTSSLRSQEHVLRDVSNGSDPTSQQSTKARSSSITTNVYENDLAPEGFSFRGQVRNRSGRYSKYSPTPSIKRGKAEKLLKEHGSPPGIRVTAGGRIVPDGVTPIASPRFLQNDAYKYQNANRIVRSHSATANSSLNAANGMIFDLGNGVFAQLVDGEFRPIELRNGIAQLPIPYPMPIPISVPGYAKFKQTSYQTVPLANLHMPYAPWPDHTPPTDELGTEYGMSPNVMEVQVMEQVHAKLEQELKDLDRNEVLQRANLTATAKAGIVKARIELVNRIDESRRSILVAKRARTNKTSSTHANLDGASSVGLGIYNAERADSIGESGMNSSRNSGPQQVSHAGFGQIPFTMQRYSANDPIHNHFLHKIPTAQSKEYHSTSNQCGPRPLFDNIDSFHEPNAHAAMDVHAPAASDGNRNSIDTVGRYPSNLDGSAHQPRRSHAIEIKAPRDLGTNYKSSLNPTSPSYQPSQNCANELQSNDGSNFVPSPSLVAQTDELVRSPSLECRELDEPTAVHQQSDDSATTADFFPHDTKQYSARACSQSTRDIHVNLPAWMNQDCASPTGQAPQGKCLSTSTFDSLATKGFRVKSSDQDLKASCDQSRRQSTAANSSLSPPHADRSCDMDFINQLAFTQISPATKRQQSAHIRNSTDTVMSSPTVPDLLRKGSVSSLLRKVSVQAESDKVFGSPPKSPEYWDGYKTGIQQAVLENNTTNDYRRGYRDGMIQSSVCAPIVVDMSTSKTTRRVSPPGPMSTVSRAQLGSSQTSLSRVEDVPRFSIPSVPHNSLATTPTAPRSLIDKSPISSVAAPKVDHDFMARLEKLERNNISNELHNPIQQNSLSLRLEDPLSPLANRSATKATYNMMTSYTPQTKPQLRISPYDYQRLQKSKPSVAQTDSPAQAFMSGQNDGPASEGGKKNSRTETFPSSWIPTSPKARMSPVKSAATAAVASIAQLTRSGGKKEQDAIKVSSPDKRPWRAKWKMNFEGAKFAEDDEIDAYKRQFADH